MARKTRRDAGGGVDWRQVTPQASMEGYPASGPTPADLAAVLIDGDVPTDDDKSDCLAFLDALRPHRLRVAFFQSLVRGTSFTKADLARESGLCPSAVGRALKRAAAKVWGEVPR